MQSSPIQFDFKSLAETLTDQEFAHHLREYGINLTKQEASHLQDILGRKLNLTEAIIYSVYFGHLRINKDLHKLLKNLPTQARHVYNRNDLDSNLIEIAEVEGKKYLLSLEQTNQLISSDFIQKQKLIQLTQELDSKAINKNLSFGADTIAAVKVLSANPHKEPEYRYKFRTAHKYSARYLNSLGIPYLNGKIQYTPDLAHDFIQNTLHLGLLSEDELVPQVFSSDALDKSYKVILLGRPSDLSGFENSPFLNKIDLPDQPISYADNFYDKHLFLSLKSLFTDLKEEDLLNKIALRSLDTGGLITALLKLLQPSGRGAEIDLSKIPSTVTNEAITLCASTPGRFVLLVPTKLSGRVLDHFNKTWRFNEYFPEAKAVKIGDLSGKLFLDVNVEEDQLCSLPLSEFKYEEAETNPNLNPLNKKEEVDSEGLDLSDEEILEMIRKLLKRRDFISHNSILNWHDRSVQGQCLSEFDKTESPILLPLKNRLDLEGRSEQNIGITIGLSSNYAYAKIDPKQQASLSTLNAMRKVAATGATPWCVSDALNFKHFDVKQLKDAQTKAVDGLGETLRVIGHKINVHEPVPCISGSTLSHNSEQALHTDLDVSHSTTIVTVLGRIIDYKKAISSDIKKQKSTLYLVGSRKANLSGSILYQLLEKDDSDSKLPELDFEQARQEIFSLIEAIDKELVLASHSISEGGMIGALLEMFLASEELVGADIEFPTESIGLSFIEKLFSENGGFICQIASNKAEEFERLLREAGVNTNILGHVNRKKPLLNINNLSLDLVQLKQDYQDHLKRKL